MQRCLQVRIEEQGKRLQKMFEDQQATGNVARSPEPDGAVGIHTELQDDVVLVADDEA